MKANKPRPRVIGYEILRRVKQSEVPGFPLNPKTQRAVLGAWERRYLVPPGIDVFELGLIDRAGPFELLPIAPRDKPLWDGVVFLLVSQAQAERQLDLVLRCYNLLLGMIREADQLADSVAEYVERRTMHPVFGMVRLETIAVWKAMRRGSEPLGERELDVLHAAVARRVAVKIRAHFIRWP